MSDERMDSTFSRVPCQGDSVPFCARPRFARRSDFHGATPEDSGRSAEPTSSQLLVRHLLVGLGAWLSVSLRIRWSSQDTSEPLVSAGGLEPPRELILTWLSTMPLYQIRVGGHNISTTPEV